MVRLNYFMEDDAMAKSMFPSESSLTDGQIGKFQELIGAALRKRRTEFQSAPAQVVLTKQAQDLQKCVLALFRKRVNAVSDMSARSAKMDHVFPTLITIKLGIHKNMKVLQSAIKDAGFRISDEAYNRLVTRAFTLASEEITIELVTATVAELGFDKDTRYGAICDRIREFGYELCPAEVGPQLLLQYKDQPLDQDLGIAMEAIPDSGNSLDAFVVEHRRRGGRRLFIHSTNLGGSYLPEFQFVFVLPKPTTLAIPDVGEEFELAHDFDKTDPLEMVRSDEYDPEAWEFKGTKPKGKQTRRFKLVKVGYLPTLDAVRTALASHGTVPEGQWREAFKKAYPKPDGNGSIGVADPSWVGPNGRRRFPYLDWDGGQWRSRFFFADDVQGSPWRWLVECKPSADA